MPAGAQTVPSPELDALLNRIEFNSSESPATLGEELAALDEASLAANRRTTPQIRARVV